MGRVLRNAVIHQQIAADIPRRKPHAPGGGNKDLRVILANALADPQRGLGGCLRIRLARRIGDGVGDQGGQRMKLLDAVDDAVIQFPDQGIDTRSGQGQVGAPAEIPQRRTSRVLADDAVNTGCLDCSGTGDGDRGGTGFQTGEHRVIAVMVAECRLALHPLDLHIPGGHGLAGAGLRRQQQALQAIGLRSLERVTGAMGDGKLHGYLWNL